MAGTWAPYTGTDSIVLAAVLILVGLFSAYLGTRLRNAVVTSRPGKAVAVLLMTIWILSLLAFFFDSIVYGYVLLHANLVATYQSYTAPNPVSPITDVSAAVSFIAIAQLARKHGWKIVAVSAFVGAAAGPMIFELPFDLIVLTRIYPPIPPFPNPFRLLFFLPLFLIEISTLSLLTFSPLAKLSKYTMFSLAGMFFLFAGWAIFGFSFPSDPVSAAFNDVSKVVSFITAVTLFLGESMSGTTSSQAPVPR